MFTITILRKGKEDTQTDTAPDFDSAGAPNTERRDYPFGVGGKAWLFNKLYAKRKTASTQVSPFLAQRPCSLMLFSAVV